MKYPFLPVVMCVAAGIVFADLAPLSLGWLLAGGLALAAASIAWTRVATWTLGLALVLAGAANQTLHTAVLHPQDLRTLAGDKASEAIIEGTLKETPYLRQYETRTGFRERTIAYVDVGRVCFRKGPWMKAYGTVAVSTSGHLPQGFHGGQGVRVEGVLSVPDPALAEGLFDYRSYLRRLGVYHVMRVENASGWRIEGATMPEPWPDRFTRWARGVLGSGLPNDQYVRLLWAMTLGWKTGLAGDIETPFMRSGTLHVFAISGLHIALITTIAVQLLRVVGVSRFGCFWIVLPSIWAYTYATGMQASAVRSAIMSSVVIAGWGLHRPGNMLNSLVAAAAIILVWDPQQLFQPGFQLSFGVVLSLIVFAPFLDPYREELLKPDPFLPEVLRPWWQKKLFPAANWLGRAVVASVAAFVGSIPLIAHYFHMITPSSLLANLVVVPLSDCALACNVISLLVGGWWPWMAEFYNHSAWLLMRWMVAVSEWSARMPAGYFHIAGPSWAGFCFYYGVIFSLAVGWLKPWRGRRYVVAGLGVLALAVGLGWARDWGRAELTVLSLNGGHAVFYDAPGTGGDWLIDTGNADAAKHVTQPFLMARGINWLPHLVLTHGDASHVGGAEDLSRQFRVREALCSPVGTRSRPYQQVVRYFERQKRLQTVRLDTVYPPWRVLHPDAASPFTRADENIVVLLGEIQGTRVLLLSELAIKAQSQLMARGVSLKADVVIAGLPSGSEPLADPLIDAIAPKLIILADADYPPQRRAGPRLKSRLARHGIPVLYTRDCGAITLAFNKSGWTWRTMRAGAESEFSGGAD